MASLNKWMGIGNVTRDPELRHLPKGAAVAQIGLAFNRQWKNDAGEKCEEVTFIDVEFFGRRAEVLGEYTKKGHPLYVEGRLKLDTWEKDGTKHYKLKVIGETFEFLGGASKGNGGAESPRAPEGAAQREEDTSEIPF